MDALLVFLDHIVAELECFYYLRKADDLIDYLDYLEAIAFLDAIRQSPEYHSIRAR